MTNFKNKNGQFQKTAFEKVTSFLAYNKSNNYRLLSDFYSSRSTNYHSIYNSELFEISEDKEVIVAAGFSRAAKRVIRVNITHPDVIEMMSIFEKQVEEKRKHDAELAAYNTKRKQAVDDEANSIVIDEDFKTAVKWASEATGEEKSKRMASALKGLLSRLGLSEIKSDFWQVLRILKARVN